jgi:hypothetical protein
MSAWIEVTPAYGRDYTTAKAAKADWNKGFDLKVIIRYAKSTKVTGTS